MCADSQYDKQMDAPRSLACEPDLAFCSVALAQSASGGGSRLRGSRLGAADLHWRRSVVARRKGLRLCFDQAEMLDDSGQAAALSQIARCIGLEPAADPIVNVSDNVSALRLRDCLKGLFSLLACVSQAAVECCALSHRPLDLSPQQLDRLSLRAEGRSVDDAVPFVAQQLLNHRLVLIGMRLQPALNRCEQIVPRAVGRVEPMGLYFAALGCDQRFDFVANEQISERSLALGFTERDPCSSRPL